MWKRSDEAQSKEKAKKLRYVIHHKSHCLKENLIHNSMNFSTCIYTCLCLCGKKIQKEKEKKN